MISRDGGNGRRRQVEFEKNISRILLLGRQVGENIDQVLWVYANMMMLRLVYDEPLNQDVGVDGQDD